MCKCCCYVCAFPRCWCRFTAASADQHLAAEDNVLDELFHQQTTRQREHTSPKRTSRTCALTADTSSLLINVCRRGRAISDCLYLFLLTIFLPLLVGIVERTYLLSLRITWLVIHTFEALAPRWHQSVSRIPARLTPDTQLTGCISSGCRCVRRA